VPLRAIKSRRTPRCVIRRGGILERRNRNRERSKSKSRIRGVLLNAFVVEKRLRFRSSRTREREREGEREAGSSAATSLSVSGWAEYSVFVEGLRDSTRAALCKRIYEIWPRRCHGTTYDGRIENICRTRRVGHAFVPSAVAKSRNSLENGDDGGRARIPAADWSTIFSRDLFTLGKGDLG